MKLCLRRILLSAALLLLASGVASADDELFGTDRLRIGVGHPGTKERVVGHVLKAPAKDELALARLEGALKKS